MTLKRMWVVFYCGGRELLRYTLKDEAPGERKATKELLAYENGVRVEEIDTGIETTKEEK